MQFHFMFLIIAYLNSPFFFKCTYKLDVFLKLAFYYTPIDTNR